MNCYSVVCVCVYFHSQVMEKLLGISFDYWRQYLSPMEHPDPTVSPTSSVQSVQSSPALLSPATPELRPGEISVCFIFE